VIAIVARSPAELAAPAKTGSKSRPNLMSSRRAATEVAIEVAHTAQMAPAALSAARQLLDLAFDGGFDGTDWEHTLGGVHITASTERSLMLTRRTGPRTSERSS
jgi:hypothetical protein